MKNSKLCTTCNETKDIKDFYPNPGHGDGYRPLCKACMKEARTVRVTAEPTNLTERLKQNGVYANGGALSPTAGVVEFVAPRRIPYINGGYLNKLPAGAERAAKEEFWTKFHLHFASTDQAGRPALFRFLGFPVPLVLDVMSSPELRREIILYSHGYMARGWGQKYAWGTLPALPTHHQQKS